MTAISIPVLTPASTQPAQPSLRRLAVVELRKMTDTRSGRWLMAVVGLMSIAMLLLPLFARNADDRNAATMFAFSQVSVVLLLPVLGILSVTSEWTKRTALTTFALVPIRRRVATAKLIAGAALGTIAVLIGAAAAMICRIVGGWFGQTEAGMTIPVSLIGTSILYAVIMVLIGVAFGMLLLNASLAIVIFFFVPFLWTTLGEAISALNGVAAWLNTATALGPLHGVGITGQEWAKICTSTAVWLMLPLLAGFTRLVRSELK